MMSNLLLLFKRKFRRNGFFGDFLMEREVPRLPLGQFKVSHSLQLARAVGKPLVSSAHVVDQSNPSGSTWIALRVVTALVHILQDGQIMVCKLIHCQMYLTFYSLGCMEVSARGSAPLVGKTE